MKESERIGKIGSSMEQQCKKRGYAAPADEYLILSKYTRKEKYSCKRTDVLNCGYTFLSIHDIICLTGRKASAPGGSICFYPVWQRRTEGSEHDRMNEVNSVMCGDL